MKSSTPGFSTVKSLLFFLILLGVLCCMSVSSPLAQETKSEDTTDLSQMDWSDDPEEADLSQESWADEETEAQSGGELSDMSWEDEEGEYEGEEAAESDMTMTQAEETALDLKEQRIHIFGFLMFVGYIIGGLLTGYFTRNRKLAVEYPPELLILLHTVWPLEWIFMLFAGKKVR